MPSLCIHRDDRPEIEALRATVVLRVALIRIRFRLLSDAVKQLAELAALRRRSPSQHDRRRHSRQLIQALRFRGLKMQGANHEEETRWAIAHTSHGSKPLRAHRAGKRWGYRKLVGAMTGLGHLVSRSTIPALTLAGWNVNGGLFIFLLQLGGVEYAVFHKIFVEPMPILSFSETNHGT